MTQLKFRDMKSRKNFLTDKYKLISKKTKIGVRYFAVAKAPSGVDAYRIVGKDFYNKSGKK